MSDLSEAIEKARARFPNDYLSADVVTRLLLSGAAAGVTLVVENLPNKMSSDSKDAVAAAYRIIRKMEKHL